MRDYDREERGAGIVKHYGVRGEGGVRYVIIQVWDFHGEVYDLTMYFVADDGEGPAAQAMRPKSYAIGTGRLLELVSRAGFASVGRIDGRFYQPLLIGGREG